MSMPLRTGRFLIVVLLAVGVVACQRSRSSPHAQKSSAQVSPSVAKPGPPIQSGVYGFSGARVADSNADQGVIGECIWIYDGNNQTQVAKGDCYKNNPGAFRVPLKPGHYVVRGPGGNTPIDVKSGGWVKVESIVSLPLAP